MKIEITNFENGARISHKCGFCVPVADGGITFGQNRNPEIKWSGAPEGTKSFALICVDPDVPSVGDDVNKEGVTVSKDLPRVDFYHLVLVDIPVSITHIPDGALSNGITEGGKNPGKNDFGVSGINDYTGWFAEDEKMRGFYGGYDGPCPPWNDELIHRYFFRIYALDTDSLGLEGNFDGREAMDAINKHKIAQAEWGGTYTLNKGLLK